MAIFTAYSDESGSGDGLGEFLIGGYVASADYWPFVVNAWKERVLDASPSIPYLHMTEIRRGAFQNKYKLSRWQAFQRVDTAVDVLRSSGGIQGVFCSVNADQFRRSLESIFRERGLRVRFSLKEPDYVCYLGYAYNLLDEVRSTFKNVDKVDFVVAHKKKVTDHIKHFHEQLREVLAALDPGLEPLVGTLIPGDPDTCPALQTADVLCWHLQGSLNRQSMSANMAKLALGGGRKIRQYEHGRVELAELESGIIERREGENASELPDGIGSDTAS